MQLLPSTVDLWMRIWMVREFSSKIVLAGCRVCPILRLSMCVAQDQGPAMLEVRWLLELRMQQYTQAAGTLGRVAQAQGGDAHAFTAAKQAACLAKLALLADQEGGLAPVRPKVGCSERVQDRVASIEYQLRYHASESACKNVPCVLKQVV